MNKNKTLLQVTLLAISALFLSANAIAQDDSDAQPSIFLVVTNYVVVPDDGSMEELLEMLAENREATENNPKVLSRTFLRHYFTGDSREFVTITEYESLAAMEEAFEITEQLIEARWPDEDERDARQSKIGSYISRHSDAIFSNMQ